ncbi:hypothetical protein ID866_2549 [Astraeus odoratus]|nr:hypothetical protein ID866_2549 [Astraeus odoratus]
MHPLYHIISYSLPFPLAPPPPSQMEAGSKPPSAFSQHRARASVADPASAAASFTTTTTNPVPSFPPNDSPIVHISSRKASISSRSVNFAASPTPITTSPGITSKPHSGKDHNDDGHDPPTMLHQHSLSTAPDRLNIPPPSWTSTPPSPPANALIYSSSSMLVRPRSAHILHADSLLEDSPDLISQQNNVIKRRASLPIPTITKPLPPIPVAAQPPQDHINIYQKDVPSPDRHLDTSSHRARPLFQIGSDVPEKEDQGLLDDDVHVESGRPHLISTGPLRLSTSSVSKEDARRCHALVELLSTELAYLIDLRILVCVYLRSLPVLTSRNAQSHTHGSSSNISLSNFSRTPSMLGISHLNGNQHAHSYQQVHTAKSLSASQSTDGHAPNLFTLPPTKEKDRNTSRHLFTPADLEIITRNADEILEFHEKFVHELHTAVSKCGFSMRFGGEGTLGRPTHPTDLERAIDAVSTVFIRHAPSFDRYQGFCSGHPLAFDLVRKVQQKYPSDWEAFEHRCADIAAKMLTEASNKPLRSPTPDDHRGSPVAPDVPKKRRHSLSALDPFVCTWTQPHVISSLNLKSSNGSTSESGHSDNDVGSRRPRLLFVDYLIKPVQRICKYPLLLTQLQATATGGHTEFGKCHEVVNRAIHVMRAMTSAVDEARRRQELSVKSGLIVARMCQAISVSMTNTSQQPLTPVFLSSLGFCHTAGSLDVIYYCGCGLGRSNTVKAKYLGAFLFPGGFFVLAKVAKSKLYEPRYWFSLRGFEVADSNTDDALLQSWFRLSSRGHTFELAAACRREKDVWMDAIRGAISQEPVWEGDPPSSLQADVRNDGALGDVEALNVTSLPTIQSIPELDSDADLSMTGEVPVASNLSEASHTRWVTSRMDYSSKMDGPNRRSSLTSGKSYQTSPTECDTFHLVRSNAMAREQVDRLLLDVFSQKCLTARLQAHTHEEDLFEAQKVSRSFSRSSSGLTMASAMSVAAMNRLTKRESVLVPRRRSFVDTGSNSPSDIEGPAFHPHIKPAGKRHQPKKHPKIVTTAKSASSDYDEDIGEVPLESPSPMSQCSSMSAVVSAPPLTLPCPLTTALSGLDNNAPPVDYAKVRRKDYTPKRSRSMIENVRGLFISRSSSPNSPLARESSVKSASSGSSLFRWWTRESIRQRSRSAPDAPQDELPASKSLGSQSQHPSIPLTDESYSQPDLERMQSFSAHEHGTSIEAMALNNSPRKTVPLASGDDDYTPRRNGHDQNVTRRVFHCGVVVEGCEGGKSLPDDVRELVLSLGDPWLGQVEHNIIPSVSEVTMSDSVGLPDRPRSETDLSALSDVVNEFVNTERSYVKRLRILKHDYADPLRQFSRSKSTAILPPYEAKTLFGNIDNLLPVNEAFLADLEQMMEPGGSRTVGRVGDVALKHFKELKGFEHYKQYYVKREEAQAIFEREMMKKSSGFAAYIDRIKYSNADARNRVGLRELLMDPVQRIPRYTLLFRTMLKLMGPDDPQRALLVEADEIASKIAQAETDEETLRDVVMDAPMAASASTSSISATVLHCTLFLFDDKLMIAKRPGNGERSGRTLSGLDEVKKSAKTGGLPLGLKKSGMSCKGVFDVTDIVAADIGDADFHIYLENPPQDQGDRWSGRPFRSLSVVLPPASTNLDPTRPTAEKERFLENLWSAQAKYRTRYGQSVVLCANETEVEVKGSRTTLARTYFNIYQRTAFLQEIKKTKIVMHIDALGTADPIPFDPNGDPEEDIVQTARVPGRIVQTIQQYGLFKFRTENDSRPATPTASTRSRAHIFSLDAISRNLFSSRPGSLKGELFGGSINSHSRSRSKSSTSRSSVYTQTTTTGDGSLAKFSYRSGGSVTTAATSVASGEEDSFSLNRSASSRKKLVKRGRSPGSGRCTPEPFSNPVSRCASPEKYATPDEAETNMDRSEDDLASRLELARRNSQNQHNKALPPIRDSKPIEDTIYEGKFMNNSCRVSRSNVSWLEEPPLQLKRGSRLSTMKETENYLSSDYRPQSPVSSLAKLTVQQSVETRRFGPRSPSLPPTSPTPSRLQQLPEDADMELEDDTFHLGESSVAALPDNTPSSIPRSKRQSFIPASMVVNTPKSPTHTSTPVPVSNIEPLSIRKKSSIRSGHSTYTSPRKPYRRVSPLSKTVGRTISPRKASLEAKNRPMQSIATAEHVEHIRQLVLTTKENIDGSHRALKRIKLDLDELRPINNGLVDPGRSPSPEKTLARTPQRTNAPTKEAQQRLEEMRQLIGKRQVDGTPRIRPYSILSESLSPSTPRPANPAAINRLEDSIKDTDQFIVHAIASHESLQDNLERLLHDLKGKSAEFDKARTELQNAKRQCELMKSLLADATAEKEIMPSMRNWMRCTMMPIFLKTKLGMQ